MTQKAQKSGLTSPSWRKCQRLIGKKLVITDTIVLYFSLSNEALLPWASLKKGDVVFCYRSWWRRDVDGKIQIFFSITIGSAKENGQSDRFVLASDLLAKSKPLSRRNVKK